MAPRITEIHPGAVTGMENGCPLLCLRSPQTKGIQRDTEVKQDLKKSPPLLTEILLSLTGTTVMTSGRTEEALDLKLKVPMGHRIHTTTSLLVDTTSWHLEGVQLMGAKDSHRLQLFIVGTLKCMAHTVCRSHPPPTPATNESDPLLAQPTGAGLQVMAGTVHTNKESLVQVLMEIEGDHAVHTENP